jgi:type III secretion protein L
MSKVIKAGAPAEVRPIIPSEVFEAKSDAERLWQETTAKAERLLVEARSEAERLRAQAVAEGRERGLSAVTELLAGARLAAARARSGAEADLRALGVRIAEKILGRELALHPDVVVDVAMAALEHAGAPRELLFRVHPDDLAALERGRPRLIERGRGAQALTFRADERVARGGCIVETELGVVDARLSTQLEAIERALRGDLEMR